MSQLDSHSESVDFIEKSDPSLPGWNGKFCTISGCPNNCFDRGQCKLTDKQSYSLDREQKSVAARGQKIWKCFCHVGFTGEDCTTPTETECQDNEDNDNGKKYFSYSVFHII